MMRTYRNFAGLAVAGAALTLGGCMMPAEFAEPYTIKEPVAPPEAVPPLPDYSGSYRPDATVGWSSDWNRDAAQRPKTAGDYYLIDAADGLAQAIGDAPPDFAFRFDGRDAWIWLSNEGEAMIVEPSPYGVIQYYYAPRAAAPYLVRDVYQSYAFDGPDLVASYGQDGRLDRRALSPRTLDSAQRLQARGRAIMAASYRRRWDDSLAASWSVQTFGGFGFGDNYGSGIGRGWSGGWQPRWRERRDWSLERDRRRDRDARRRLEDEARERAQTAERFRQWRREGRRGTAPTIQRGQPTGSYGVDTFVQPVAPPARRPWPGAGPIMAPGSGDGQPRPNGDGRRGDFVPPVVVPTQPQTGDAPALITVPEYPTIGRRNRPVPPARDLPATIETVEDSGLAARAAAARDAERARDEAEQERRARAAAAAADQAIAAEAELASERQAAARAQVEAQQDAERRAQAMAQERTAAAEAAAAEAAAARAASAEQAAAQAAADAVETRRNERRGNGEEENVRPE